MKLHQVDATSTITALTLDMSEAGAATFNSTIAATGLTVNSAYSLPTADGTNGQVKIFVMTTAPSTSSSYRVTVTNWGSTATGTQQLQFNAIGESATCIFTNSKWYVIASNGAGVVN